MEKNKKMTCIFGQRLREVINQANELDIKKDDILGIYELGGQIYLIYYR